MRAGAVPAWPEAPAAPLRRRSVDERPPVGVQVLGHVVGPGEVLGAVPLALGPGLHDIDLERATAPGGLERDLLAVRGPDGIVVIRRFSGQPLLPGAVGVHHPDVGIAVNGPRERDPGAVRRPIWVAVAR